MKKEEEKITENRIDRLNSISKKIKEYEGKESNLVKVEFLIKDEIKNEELKENDKNHIENLQSLLDYELVKCNTSKKTKNKSDLKEDYGYLINRFERLVNRFIDKNKNP